MRENMGLYRGKRKDNGEWVEGAYYKQTLYYGDPCEKHYIITSTESLDYDQALEYYEVDPETVGQYIGIPDKNGKKIFEDDIVRADDYIFVVRYGKCGGTPNADNYGYMGFYLEALSEGTKLCAKYGLRDDICYFEDIEVIDNIHDNKKMIFDNKD